MSELFTTAQSVFVRVPLVESVSLMMIVFPSVSSILLADKAVFDAP